MSDFAKLCSDISVLSAGLHGVTEELYDLMCEIERMSIDLEEMTNPLARGRQFRFGTLRGCTRPRSWFEFDRYGLLIQGLVSRSASRNSKSNGVIHH